AVRLARRIGDPGGGHALRQEVDPPVDLPEPPPAILVIGVFRAVAVRRRPGDRLEQLRPFAREQRLIFLAQLPKTRGRDVVRALRHPPPLPSFPRKRESSWFFQADGKAAGS